MKEEEVRVEVEERPSPSASQGFKKDKRPKNNMTIKTHARRFLTSFNAADTQPESHQ